MAHLVRVYIACSLDGFIAGADDDLSWLPGAGGEPVDASEQDPAAISYDEFMSGIGALLMGRRTFDVAQKFEGWPYGQLPVIVATNRDLNSSLTTVQSAGGDIGTLVEIAKAAAGSRDVYLDGGALIRSALDEGLVDDLIVTLVPTILGSGHPLFAGVSTRRSFEILAHHTFAGGLVQLHLRPL